MATAVLSTTVRTKAREARKEAKKSGITRQPSLDSTSGAGLGEIPMERVTSHLSTASYLSMDAVSVFYVWNCFYLCVSFFSKRERVC